MKYEHEIIILLSRFQVVEYFTNPNTLKNWFLIRPSGSKWFNNQSHELLEGEPGQPGAKTIFRDTTKDRYGTSHTLESIHTVIKNDLPDEYVFSLETKGVKSISYNYFQEEARDVTRWISRNEVELSGAPKIFSFVSKRGIRYQSRLMMKRFKKHAERAY
ncbi:MAG: SRPBCC family protein, partial [Promethearchaeota archaeon]